MAGAVAGPWPGRGLRAEAARRPRFSLCGSVWHVTLAGLAGALGCHARRGHPGRNNSDPLGFYCGDRRTEVAWRCLCGRARDARYHGHPLWRHAGVSAPDPLGLVALTKHINGGAASYSRSPALELTGYGGRGICIWCARSVCSPRIALWQLAVAQRRVSLSIEQLRHIRLGVRKVQAAPMETPLETPCR